MINCVFAKVVSENVTECRNSGKSHMHRAAQAFCTRCKYRIAIKKSEPPIIEKMPESRQMRIEEWLKM